MTVKKLRLFILEDVRADAELLLQEFHYAGIKVESQVTSSLGGLVEQIRSFKPDVILADYSLPGFNGLTAFKLLRDKKIDTPFILVSGELSEDIIVEFLKEGIDDYVMKNSMKRLTHAVESVMKKKEIQREKDKAIEDLRKNEVALKHHAKQLDFLLSRSRLLNSILEATSDFVGISGTDFKSQYINAAGRKIIGLADDAETADLKIKDLQPGWAVRYIADEAIPHAIKHGIWRGETALLTLDQKEIPVSQVIIAHKNEKGEVEYFSTIAREIKELEKVKK